MNVRFLFVLVALSLLGPSSLFRPARASDLTVKVDGDGTVSSGVYDYSPWNSNFALSWEDYFVFPDNAGVPPSYTNYSTNSLQVVAQSGTWDNDQSGGVSFRYNFALPPYVSFGAAVGVQRMIANGQTTADYTVLVPCEYTHSYTTIMVATPVLNAQGVPTGSFTEVPGARVLFCGLPNPLNNYKTPVAMENYPSQCRLKDRGGSTYARFGSKEFNPDAPYPSGRTDDTYAFQVICDGPCQGYKSTAVGAASPTLLGTDWEGKGIVCILQPNASPDPSAFQPPGDDPTGGAGLPAGSASCAAFNVSLDPAASGGGPGQASWTDGNAAFTAAVKPAFLHTPDGTYQYSVTVPATGSWTITADGPTAPSWGAVVVSAGGQSGPSVSQNGSAGSTTFTLGTFNLTAGSVVLTFKQTGAYSSFKTLHLTPSASCSASSGTGTSGTGTGTGTGADPTADNFFTGFWDKFEQEMIKLMVPGDASKKNLTDAIHALTSYGPFGIVGQLATLFGKLSVVVQDGNRGHSDYWYWYLGRPAELRRQR